VPSVELASFTASHNVLRVGNCRGLVKTLSESFPDKGSWSGMVTTGAGVYLSQQLAALIPRDTSHEYAGGPALVKLAVDEDKCFGSAGKCRASVWSEGSFPSTSHSRMGNHQSGSLRFTSGGSSIDMTSGPGSSGGFSTSSRTDG
jgi:hypothetical protein